jgi:anti-sigma regulatory factor (Ser/Thr protein kinase)
MGEPPMAGAPGRSPERSLARDLPAIPGSLARLRGDVRSLLVACGVDATRAEEIVLGVHEAAMNAVVHAYERDGGRVKVAVVVGDDHVDATVQDSGTWQPPSADGRGLTIMAGLASEVEVRSTDDGTAVRLRFDRFER